MFDINKKCGIPIYIQIKNQITTSIKNGELKPGDKMPTERDLSQKLLISRNTISSAYNMLEREGVLVSYQGRGTFVADRNKTLKANVNIGKLIKLIDFSLEEALELGIGSDEFLALAQERITIKDNDK